MVLYLAAVSIRIREPAIFFPLTIRRVELHVGIMAACLPTLKPMFSTFFGQIRTFTKGRTSRNTGSGISAPFKSNGYVKYASDQGQSSFAMQDLSEKTQSKSRDPYDEDVMLGKDKYSVEVGGRGRLGGVRSQASESDESILSHERPSARRSIARGMTIVRTTEVNISR